MLSNQPTPCSVGMRSASNGCAPGKSAVRARRRASARARSRTTPSGGRCASKRLVEHLGQRPAAPVGRPLVRVAVGPVLRQVVRAVERRHALQPAVDVGDRDARDDRLQRGVPGGHGGPLREAVVAVAPHADVAVRPRLLRDPLDRVVAVVDLVDEGDRLALGAELAAHVLGDERIAARDDVRGQERHPAVAAVLVVRQAHEHRRERARARRAGTRRSPARTPSRIGTMCCRARGSSGAGPSVATVTVIAEGRIRGPRLGFALCDSRSRTSPIPPARSRSRPSRCACACAGTTASSCAGRPG